MSSTSLIRELAAFAATAPDSPRKTALLNQTRKHLNRRTAQKVTTQDHPVDRTRGVIAAILYLEHTDRVLTTTQITSSIHER